MPLRLALYLLLSLLAAPSASAQDTLLFVVRVDDVQSRSTLEPRRITAFEEAVADRGGLVTWAVIPHRLVEPQNQDGVLAADLRASAARGHEIAQHGYTHICPRCDRSSHEFFCTTYETPFDYEEQHQVVMRGRSLLEEHLDVTPASFVPPGHVDDETTFEVLHDAGFRTISTAEPSETLLHGDLFNVGSMREYTWALTEEGFDAELQAALDHAREADDLFVMMYHDPFVRAGYEDGLVVRWTGQLLDSLNAGAAGRPVRYVTLSQARARLAPAASSAEPPAAERTSFALHTPSPHPVRGRATFHFALGAAADVTLDVYDLLLRRVATTPVERRTAGPHRVAWDAGSLAPGTYVARLTAGARTLTRTFVVVD